MTRQKSALILGGAGFIGTHLAETLRETEQFRRIISIDISAPLAPVSRVIYRLHDVREPIHNTLDEPFDMVFNLAAVHRTPGHPDHEYYEANVIGALNAVGYCERHDIDTLFFASSIAVYGPSEDALHEGSVLSPSSPYGRSKYLAEQIHRAWQERDKERRLRIVRPAVVFGAGENGNYTRLAKMLRKGLFVYPGRTDTFKAGGYVKELVHSMMFALSREERLYLYNFADRHCPTIKEICETMCALAGTPAPGLVLPYELVNSGAAAFEVLNALGFKNRINKVVIDKLVHSTNIRPDQLIKDGYPFSYTLESSLSDWFATDPEVRPTKLKARPAPVRAPVFALADSADAEPARTLRVKSS